MAFVAENLNVIAYANGWTLWNYVSEDNLFDICPENYFAEADNDLRCGDMILFSHKGASFSNGAIFVVAQTDKNFVAVTMLASSAEKHSS